MRPAYLLFVAVLLSPAAPSQRTLRSPAETGPVYSKFGETFGTNGWEGFSDVLLSDNRIDALVYAEMHCGDLCGSGTYYWLHRYSALGKWRVRKGVESWVS